MGGSRKPVFIVGASRTPTVRYSDGDYRSMTELLAQAVKPLGERILRKVDAIYVTYRYPTPFKQRFDADEFIARARLADPEVLRFRIDPLGALGGLGAVSEVVDELSSGENGTILIVGGEAFEPSVAEFLSNEAVGRGFESDKYHRPYRRLMLSRYGGLEPDDRAVGLTPPSAHALVADALFRESGLSIEEVRELMCLLSCHLEKYAILNRNSYQNNLSGGRRFDPIKPQLYKEKEETRLRKWPFHWFDICGIVNSAAALVLTNQPPEEGRAKLRVASCALDRRGGGGLLGREELHSLSANASVWEMTREQLDVDILTRPRPGARRNIFELVDTFAYQIPMTFMDMGMFADLRSFLKDLRDGYFDAIGSGTQQLMGKGISGSCGVILNPSGGSRDGTPHSGYALVRAAECFRFMTSENQVLPRDEIDLAFVHGLSLSNTAGVLALTRD